MSLKNPSRNSSPTADLAYGFGVKENVMRTCVMNELKNNGSNKRKQQMPVKHNSTATRNKIKCGQTNNITQNCNTKSMREMNYQDRR